MPDRAAQPGELCTCGRQAVTVYEFDERPPIGHCGQADGDRIGPCPFCGATAQHRHPSGDPAPCPQYRLRPDTA